MDVMDEIHERLGETERRAAEVVRRLEQLDSLERSLAKAGEGLGDASAGISSLAAAASTAVDSLNATVAAFREAVEDIRRSDPATVKEILVGLEGRLDRVTAKLGVLDEFATELRETRKAIAGAARTSERETKKLAEEVVERLSRQTFIDWLFGRYRPLPAARKPD